MRKASSRQSPLELDRPLAAGLDMPSDSALPIDTPPCQALPFSPLGNAEAIASTNRSSLLRTWLSESVWPGLGLFGESYILFSLGTLQPLWRILFPDCWPAYSNIDDAINSECSTLLRDSLTYSVVLGVMSGMVGFGVIASHVGRRTGSIATASFMACGAMGLTIVSMALMNHPRRLFQSMALLLFVFGIGVGGEYPLSACSASEKTMQVQSSPLQQSGILNNTTVAQNRPHTRAPKRGRAVQLVFTMQGMGIFFNSFFMMVLLLATGQTGRNGDYDLKKLQFIWCITYAVGAAVLLYVLVSRYRHLRESAAWEHDKLQRVQSTGNPQQSAGNSQTNHVPIALDDRYYEVQDGNDASSLASRGPNIDVHEPTNRVGSHDKSIGKHGQLVIGSLGGHP